MQQFTKKAIMESFIKLLDQEPLSKITIKQIVDDCGVNRNTFYYYFEDIYALVDELFTEEIRKSKNSNWITNTWQENFLNIMQFTMENKKFIHNLYTSINRERLTRYIEELSELFVEGLVRDCAKNTSADEDDILVVIRLEKYLIMGCIVEWLANGMKDQLGSSVFELGSLFSESITLLLDSLAQMR